MGRSLLGKAFDEAAGPGRKVCSTCLGPNPPGVLKVLTLFGDEPLPACETCGNPTDHSGQSMIETWKDGLRCGRILRVHRGKQGSEP